MASHALSRAFEGTLGSVWRPGYHLLRTYRRPFCELRCLSSPAAATVRHSVWSLLQGCSYYMQRLERPAVVCGESGARLSHRELREHALSLAGKLVNDLGYVAGDRLALVLAGNCVESIVAQLAAAAAGITVVTAAKAEHSVLQGCRGMVVSAKLLQGMSPVGVVKPIVVQKKQRGLGDIAQGRGTSTVLMWENAINCSPMDIPLSDAHEDILLAVYGGAKVSERQQTQAQMSQLAVYTAAKISLSDADRVVVAAPLDTPFGFGSGALAGIPWRDSYMRICVCSCACKSAPFIEPCICAYAHLLPYSKITQDLSSSDRRERERGREGGREGGRERERERERERKRERERPCPSSKISLPLSLAQR